MQKPFQRTGDFVTETVTFFEHQVEEAFAKFDASGDDQLDYKEFCQMIHKKQEGK